MYVRGPRLFKCQRSRERKQMEIVGLIQIPLLKGKDEAFGRHDGHKLGNVIIGLAKMKRLARVIKDSEISFVAMISRWAVVLAKAVEMVNGHNNGFMWNHCYRIGAKVVVRPLVFILN